MKQDTRIGRILSHVPLTPKLLIITLLVWGLVWGVLEYLQSDRLKKITDTQLTRLLEQQAMENRIRFDNYVMGYHDMAMLIVSQKTFADHVRGYGGFSDGTKGITYHTEIPSWLPDASVMRHFVRIHNAVLIDGRGRVREVYQGTAKTVPQSLLPPSAHLLQKSRGQSMLAVVDGVPYLIASEAAKDAKGDNVAVAALISPIDDEFLSASQGVASGKGIIALVETIRQKVVASNAPDLIPEGTPLDTLTDRYLITSKAFFDWGGSELLMQFTAFVSKDELAEMGRSMLAEGRLQRAFISLALLLSFVMIMLWITGRIHRMTGNITDFSHNILNMRMPDINAGRDQLIILEERFAMFKDEIIESRERLKRHAEELLKEKTMYLDNLLHSSSMAVVVTDLDLKIKHFNPTAEMFFSIRSEDAIGKTIPELKLEEIHYAPCFAKISNKSSGDEECICTTVSRTAKGEQVLESKVSWVKDRDGNVSGLLLITQDITTTIALKEELEKLSVTDSLTGCYNRRGFIALANAKLKLSLRTMEKIVLIYADMDNLKAINDNAGHQEGDKALVETANILKSTFRETDVIARLGGDEFAILSIDTSDEKVIQERIKRSIDSHNKKVPVHKLSMSIGVVCYDPEKPCTLDDLLSRADSLMYVNKLSKKG